MPILRKAGVSGTGSVIGLPLMPSWLCTVRLKATEDWLTALKCHPVGTDGTIKGSANPAHASELPLATALAAAAAVCVRSSHSVVWYKQPVCSPSLQHLLCGASLIHGYSRGRAHSQ